MSTKAKDGQHTNSDRTGISAAMELTGRHYRSLCFSGIIISAKSDLKTVLHVRLRQSITLSPRHAAAAMTRETSRLSAGRITMRRPQKKGANEDCYYLCKSALFWCENLTIQRGGAGQIFGASCPPYCPPIEFLRVRNKKSFFDVF